MWVKYNDNPTLNITRDCAIRAVGVALDISWGQAFILLASMAYQMGETMDSDLVWGAVLRQEGFSKHLAPDCVGCYTIAEFADEHPQGIYVMKTDGHVVAAVDGNYYDSFDSGNEPLIYYWSKN